MKILTPGHKYVLRNFERPQGIQLFVGDVPFPAVNPHDGQTIQFIEKRPKLDAVTYVDSEGTDKRFQLETVNNGTTNEEVLAMLIDRINFLQAKFPCRENAIVITKLEESLMWLNKRTADRLTRGVEGTNAK